jgi:Protein of unknown function (DUF3108)
MKIAPALAVMLLAAAFACSAATSVPQSVSASYNIYRNGLHVGVMDETFEVNNDEYRIVSDTRAVGLLALFLRQPARFVSSGRLTGSGLQPLRFEGKRSDDDPRRVRGEFDWQAGQLTIEHSGQTEKLPLPRGTQDRLSIMYQLMFLGSEKQPRMEIAMTNGRKLGRYQYTAQPGVEIDTALGRLTTLHVVRQHKADENDTEIWLSPQHRFLPVKVLLDEDGTRYEQLVIRLEIRDARP